MKIEYTNNPAAAIEAINMALSRERASEVSVQTVRMAKGFLSGEIRANESMKAAARQLKSKLLKASSVGIEIWNNA